MKHNFLYYLILIFILHSCSFDFIFLHPQEFPDEVVSATINTKYTTDTIVVKFNGDNHQPEFYNTIGEGINIGYTVESMIFKSSNGNNLNGWLLKPKDSIAINATIFHLHGNGGSILGHFTLIDPLIKYGFQVFMFDYSGFGFSEGKASQKNTILDAFSAFDFMVKRKDIKNTEIIIYGHSFGGHLAATIAAKKESEIIGLVMEGAFSTPQDIAAHYMKKFYMPQFFARKYVKSDYDAITFIKKYHKPLIIIHSNNDEEIPFYMGQKIYDAANEPKAFIEIDSCHMCGLKLYPEKIVHAINNMVNTK